MHNLRRAIFLGTCGAAVLATLYLGASVSETSHRPDRRGPETPGVSDPGRTSPFTIEGKTRTEHSPLTEGVRDTHAARLRRLAEKKAEHAARAADNRARSEWDREMRRLAREARHEAKRAEREAERDPRRKKERPAPLFDPPDLGPGVVGIDGFPADTEDGKPGEGR